MRVLRIIFAGLMALAVLIAGVLTAGVVILAGLAAYVMQLFRGNAGVARPIRPEKTNRESATRTDDVIDVETTKVPVETDRRPL